MTGVSQWQPIETVPTDRDVDVWVVSDLNPGYGQRITNVHFANGKWFGVDLRWHYPKFWMPIPQRPSEQHNTEKCDSTARKIVSNLLWRARREKRRLKTAMESGDEMQIIIATCYYSAAHNAAEISRRYLYGTPL